MEELWRDFLHTDIALPLASSFVTGILIGFERELRAKAAGLRTHALVCFAATLLMLAGTQQADWSADFLPGTSVVSDPTRMAHGILTGIGFLGAGVIFREGPSVHGLTTAASLWMTAALGIVYGVGMYWLAVAGTVATLVVLTALRLLYNLAPRGIEVELEVTAAADTAFDAPALRALLARHGLPVRAVGASLSRAAGSRALTTTTVVNTEDAADALAGALAAEPGVLAYRIAPLEEDASFAESRF